MTEKYGYRDLLIESLGNSCKKCGSDTDIEIDHIVLRSHGGEHKLFNIQLLCGGCREDKVKKDGKLISGSSRKKSDTLLHISNNLRARRTELNHRQEDVASALEMPRGTYAGFEVGLFLPSLRVMDSFIDFFKCEPSDLYDDSILSIINLESNNS